MKQFLLKVFRSILNLLSAELPERDLCHWTAKMRDRKMTTEFLLDLASCTTGRAALGVHSAGQPADWRDTAVQRLDTTHFYCPPVTLKRS